MSDTTTARKRLLNYALSATPNDVTWEKAEQLADAFRDEVTPWSTVAALAAWLDEMNGTGSHETAVRLMKLSEEMGEVTQAYIGMVGQNPRKGVTHTEADVADELCDVIVTAMVALHQFTDDPAGHFAEKIQRIAARVNVQAESGEHR